MNFFFQKICYKHVNFNHLFFIALEHLYLCNFENFFINLKRKKNQIDAILETPYLLSRLIELLDENDTVRAALRALGNLVAGGDNQTQVVLDAGLLPQMVFFFNLSSSSSS